MKRILVLTGILYVFFGLSLLAEERMWTDRGGKFQIEATLLDYDGKEVKLKKKEDGKIISVELEKLSLPDQVYVKKTLEFLNSGQSSESKPVAKESEPVAKNAKNRDKTKPSPTPEKTPNPKTQQPVTDDDEDKYEETEFSGTFRGKIPVTRISNARQIRTDLTKLGWQVLPDAVTVNELDFQLQPISFSYPKQEFASHATVEGICLAENAPEKILAAVSFSVHGGANTTRIYVGDLKTLETQSQKIPVRLIPCGLSPNGTKALFIQETSEEQHRKQKKYLTIADMTQPEFPCVGVLIPFSEFKRERGFGNEMDIDWADWVDNEQILAKSHSGHIALLKADTGVAVWTLDTSNIGTKKLTLSPTKKYLLTQCRKTDNAFILFETQTGKPLGQLHPPKEPQKAFIPTSFAFSQDGKKLATYESAWVHLWDAANGTAIDSFYVGYPFSSRKEEVIWVNSSFLLVGNTLIDIRQQIPVWKYTDVQKEDRFFAGKYWHVTSPDSTHFAALGLTIPHESMPELPPLPDSQKYAVRPGISLQVNIDPNIPDYEKVQNHVRTMLQNNGVKIDNNAAIVLKITIKSEAAEEIYYGDRYFFGRRIAGHANFTPHIMSYRIEENGETLWETRTQTSAPSIINDNELKDRTIQDVVNEKTKLTADWYLWVEIPKKLPYDKTGSSNLTGTTRQSRK